MQRGMTGRFEVTAVGGERVRAYVPAPLPPHPAIEMSAERQRLLESALLACGRLDAICTLLPDPDLFLYSYVRREAVLSSQIEGTQSSLSDLLLFELEDAPGVPFDDVVEVSNYVGALEHGINRLAEGFPLCNRLLREVHAKLLSRGRGATKQPGEFRKGQVWVGGASPALAHFVPPPPDALDALLGDLERFLHAPPDQMPPLVKAALAHVQFETIHPFSDGNGRLGRLLIALILCSEGVLREPSLYLSLYFKRRRADYYDRLNAVRVHGDWEGWLGFFLDGVAETAQQAVDTAQHLLALLARDRERIAGLGKRAGNVGLVFDQFARRVILSVPQVAPQLPLSAPTIRAAVETLQDLEIVNELTGQQRNRVFAYSQYLDILGEGAQPL